MDIFEKLRSGEPVDMMSAEYAPAIEELLRADTALFHLNHAEPRSEEQKKAFDELFHGKFPEGVNVMTPTQMDFPGQISFGENVFINHSFTAMSIGGIDIGSNVQIGPRVTIVTDNHDLTNRYVLRCKKVVIGDNAWIGAGQTPAAEPSEEAGKPGKEPTLEAADLPCIHDEEFGGVYLGKSIDEFNALGFEYGDSLNITFSNGYTMEDIPYYTGYYTLEGEPLLVAYPGYPYVKACINYGACLWEVSGMNEHCSATVSLAERGKYLDTQEARNLRYEDDRSLFESDEAFANFRPVNVGKLKENILYRGASPCDNQRGRAAYANDLIRAAGIRFVVDLADNDEKIRQYFADPEYDSPYYRTLYENGDVIPLAFNMNYRSDEFREKVVWALKTMAVHDGPYYIHCTEGKDRTGFFCMLLEALAGASYQEIVADYMTTYDNYYGLTEASDKVKYDLLVEGLLDPMLRNVVGDDNVDLTKADLAALAEHYLRDAGMEEEQLDALKARLIQE